MPPSRRKLPPINPLTDTLSEVTLGCRADGRHDVMGLIEAIKSGLGRYPKGVGLMEVVRTCRNNCGYVRTTEINTWTGQRTSTAKYGKVEGEVGYLLPSGSGRLAADDACQALLDRLGLRG